METKLIKAIRKPRMTKAQVNEFVYWCFDESRYDELINWSSGKIRQEYLKDKNIDLSVQFINLQRRSWIMTDDKLKRI